MSDLYSAAQYLLFVIIITMVIKPLGGYLERIIAGKRTLLDRFCLPIERLIYRITRTDPAVEMTFSEYATLRALRPFLYAHLVRHSQAPKFLSVVLF